MITLAELLPLTPIIALAALVIVLMLGVAIRRHRGATAVMTCLGLAACFVTIFLTAPPEPTPVTPLFVVDGYGLFFIGLLLLTALAVTLLSVGYLSGCGHHGEEYFILLCLATLGTTVLAVATHFISVFLGIELLSVALYGMIAYTRLRTLAIEAGVKYLILAAVSSAFLLFGMSLIYARLGTMELDALARLLGGSSPTEMAFEPLVLSGLALMLVGFGFKLALVPFHMWTPDVYQGAPAPVTAFVATASKGAVMAVLLRFGAMMDLSRGGGLWMVLAGIAVVSMFAGNLLALRQQSVKRLLAYSSIAHLGYLLVAFLAGGSEAAEAVTFYLLAYTVTTLGSFGVIAVLSGTEEITRPDEEDEGPGRTEADAEDLDHLRDWRGLGKRRPWLAGVMTAMLFSLAGIPLTAGFVGKFLLLAAGAGAALWTLVVLLAVNSAIGIYYYLRVVVAIYLQPAEKAPPAPATPEQRAIESFRGSVPVLGGATLAVLMVLLLLLGVFPGPVLRLVAESCAGIF